MAGNDFVVFIDNDGIDESKPADAGSDLSNLALRMRSGILGIFLSERQLSCRRSITEDVGFAREPLFWIAACVRICRIIQPKRSYSRKPVSASHFLVELQFFLCPSKPILQTGYCGLFVPPLTFVINKLLVDVPNERIRLILVQNS